MPPSAAGGFERKPPPPWQSFGIGGVAGTGYTYNADSKNARYAWGADLALTLGAWPSFGIVARIGVVDSSVHDTAMNRNVDKTFMPLMLGFTIAPGNRRVRWEIGADGGIDVGFSCDGECPTATIGALRTGIVFYSKQANPGAKARLGFGIEFITELRDGPLDASVAMVRLSMRGCNDGLDW